MDPNEIEVATSVANPAQVKRAGFSAVPAPEPSGDIMLNGRTPWLTPGASQPRHYHPEYHGKPKFPITFLGRPLCHVFKPSL